MIIDTRKNFPRKASHSHAFQAPSRQILQGMVSILDALFNEEIGATLHRGYHTFRANRASALLRCGPHFNGRISHSKSIDCSKSHNVEALKALASMTHRCFVMFMLHSFLQPLPPSL